MMLALSCYYLDEPLADEELAFVEHSLIGPWAKFKTHATSLRQKRVPLVLPTPGVGGAYSESPEYRAERIRSNLQHAGIRLDHGHQVVWVMPRDADWDAIFQFAIREETGLAPFVVQRWYPEPHGLVRGKVRVVDTQMLVQGL